MCVRSLAHIIENLDFETEIVANMMGVYKQITQVCRLVVQANLIWCAEGWSNAVDWARERGARIGCWRFDDRIGLRS